MSVISYCNTFGCVRLAQHISLKITSKDVFISLDQHIINYCYSVYIFSQYFFSCDLDFKKNHYLLLIMTSDELTENCLFELETGYFRTRIEV